MGWDRKDQKEQILGLKEKEKLEQFLEKLI